MDLPAVRLLLLKQGDRSLEDHARDFLDMACLTHYSALPCPRTVLEKVSPLMWRRCWSKMILCSPSASEMRRTPAPLRTQSAVSRQPRPSQIDSLSLPWSHCQSRHLSPTLSRSLSPAGSLTRCKSRQHRPVGVLMEWSTAQTPTNEDVLCPVPTQLFEK